MLGWTNEALGTERTPKGTAVARLFVAAEIDGDRIQRIEQVCRYLRSQGITILLVEQNLKMARTLADRAYFFEKGQITDEIDGNIFRSEPEAVRN